MRCSRFAGTSRACAVDAVLMCETFEVQGLANNTASGRRLLVVIDTITVYYVLANVPANESDALSSMLETSASQAQFKALLGGEGIVLRDALPHPSQ